MPDPISWQQDLPFYIAAFVGGYLLGSIPFGLLLTRLAGLGDVRKIGSGNIGATNVLRTGNKSVAFLTLILDGGKGAVAVLIAKAFGPDIAVIAAAGALVGHIAPVWLKFTGGKGVATFLGIAIALDWQVGLMCCATWLVVALVFRYSSLASLASAAAAPFYFALFQLQPQFFPGLQLTQLSIFLAILIFLRHHENIRRLITGTESKIGSKTRSEHATTDTG